MKFEEKAPKLRELRRIYGGITEISKADVEREHGEAIPEIISGETSLDELEHEYAMRWWEWIQSGGNEADRPEQPDEMIRIDLIRDRDLHLINHGRCAPEWWEEISATLPTRYLDIAREAGLHIEDRTTPLARLRLRKYELRENLQPVPTGLHPD